MSRHCPNAEIKALCAGNPLIKEKMDLDIEVARLKVLKADHQSQQYRMEDKLLKYFPAEIERQTGYIHALKPTLRWWKPILRLQKASVVWISVVNTIQKSGCR